MKVNRRHFVGTLYDCILFEYGSQTPAGNSHTLSLDDLADTFAFVADFYKHNRSLMDIPCDQFITRNQLHTIAGLVDYIEDMDRCVFEIFPCTVELREEAPSFVSSSSKQDRRRNKRMMHGHSNNKSRSSHSQFRQDVRGWTTDLYGHRDYDFHNDTDTDLDDEYSIVIPGLSKTDIQTFLWEYAYVSEDYQDDIATLIRYLRRDEWVMNGSKGTIITFDWNLEGVQKFSKDYNHNKIRKVELREQEEAKRSLEAAQRQQEEWARQQEIVREKESALRIKITDDFIWKMHKSLVISSKESAEIDNLIKNLEMEISEYFDFCFVALAAVGSFGCGSYTHSSDLDLTLTGDIKHITTEEIAKALHQFNYQSVSTPLSEDRAMKETFVNGINCSFDREWEYYHGFGAKNTKTAAELLVDFCRFFGYVFDYESREVNARIGAFRWRSDMSKTPANISVSNLTPDLARPPSTLLPVLSSSIATNSALQSKINSPVVFHVNDPFMVELNITSVCRDDLVRVVKSCFQEAYEALVEGDINLVLSNA
ncbi:hypothetical protein BGX27_010120 [Mortierella sp. AM989]|nr:hypothetical protein BGX27_010120 [Mortierella sp. AM989]